MPGDLYDRQHEIGVTNPGAITVVGVGGIGSWVAIDLAMSGIENLYLFDPDVMEESNRNRLPFCQSSINRPKVEVVAEYIKAIRPECIVVAVQEKLEGILLQIQLSVSNIIMECTDSPKSQFTVYKACQAARKEFIRAGYDGTHGTVSGSVSGWIKTDSEEEHYAVNPSWVVPSQIFAALAVAKAMKYFDQ